MHLRRTLLDVGHVARVSSLSWVAVDEVVSGVARDRSCAIQARHDDARATLFNERIALRGAFLTGSHADVHFCPAISLMIHERTEEPRRSYDVAVSVVICKQCSPMLIAAVAPIGTSLKSFARESRACCAAVQHFRACLGHVEIVQRRVIRILTIHQRRGVSCQRASASSFQRTHSIGEDRGRAKVRCISRRCSRQKTEATTRADRYPERKSDKWANLISTSARVSEFPGRHVTGRVVLRSSNVFVKSEGMFVNIFSLPSDEADTERRSRRLDKTWNTSLQ